VDRFVNHVGTVLKRHNSLVVDKFMVTVALRKQHADHVDSWVGFATASKAKHVVLDLNPALNAHRQCEAPDKYEFCPAVNSSHQCEAADRYGFCPALHAHYQAKAEKYEFRVNLLSGRNELIPKNHHICAGNTQNHRYSVKLQKSTGFA
jgi:hypothetical protein